MATPWPRPLCYTSGRGAHVGVKPWEPGGEARTRGIDWIADRAVETEPRAAALERADAAWRRTRAAVAERSEFFRRRYAAAGADLAAVGGVADLHRLPVC